MDDYAGSEEGGVLRLLTAITLQFNKMVISVAVGAGAVIVPYMAVLTWLANHVANIDGGAGAIAAVFFIVCVLITLPAVAILVIGMVFKIEQVVPWDTWMSYDTVS